MSDAMEEETSSQRLLVLLGALWLLFAVAIVVLKLSNPTPITFSWRTETEINTAGFNVLRATSPNGEFRRINEELIPSQGSPVSGASYSFVDEDVDAGQTYYYRLEDVEFDNSIEQHPVTEQRALLVEWWVPVIAALSLSVGLLLLIRGIRYEKDQ